MGKRERRQIGLPWFRRVIRLGRLQWKCFEGPLGRDRSCRTTVEDFHAALGGQLCATASAGSGALSGFRQPAKQCRRSFVDYLVWLAHSAGDHRPTVGTVTAKRPGSSWRRSDWLVEAMNDRLIAPGSTVRTRGACSVRGNGILSRRATGPALSRDSFSGRDEAIDAGGAPDPGSGFSRRATQTRCHCNGPCSSWPSGKTMLPSDSPAVRFIMARAG